MRLIIAVFTLGLATISISALAQDEPKRRNPLAELDTNGDGAVSFAEYQQADSRRFSRADADEDGLLSLEELLSARPDGGPRNRDIDEQRLAAMQARMEERISAQISGNGRRRRWPGLGTGNAGTRLSAARPRQ